MIVEKKPTKNPHLARKEFFAGCNLLILLGNPKGTRTPVAGVRGQCPRPLDDGALWCPLITGQKISCQDFVLSFAKMVDCKRGSFFCPKMRCLQIYIL